MWTYPVRVYGSLSGSTNNTMCCVAYRASVDGGRSGSSDGLEERSLDGVVGGRGGGGAVTVRKFYHLQQRERGILLYSRFSTKKSCTLFSKKTCTLKSVGGLHD